MNFLYYNRVYNSIMNFREFNLEEAIRVTREGGKLILIESVMELKLTES